MNTSNSIEILEYSPKAAALKQALDIIGAGAGIMVTRRVVLTEVEIPVGGVEARMPVRRCAFGGSHSPEETGKYWVQGGTPDKGYGPFCCHHLPIVLERKNGT